MHFLEKKEKETERRSANLNAEKLLRDCYKIAFL